MTSVVLVAPGSSSGDRYRTILGRVWTGTMDNQRLGPSVRRRALSRCGSEQLHGAPSIGTADGVGDKIVPHVRARACHTFPLKVRVLYYHCQLP